MNSAAVRRRSADAASHRRRDVDDRIRRRGPAAVDRYGAQAELRPADCRVAHRAGVGAVRNRSRRQVSDGDRTGERAGRSRASIIDGEPLPLAGLVQLGGALSWELDFWGKFRRATEAARAEIAASEWGRRAIITSLVSQVGTLYYDLRALDLELEICAADADVARRVAAADRDSGARRRRAARGRAAGRTARLLGTRHHRRYPAANRAVGERVERAARTESRTDRRAASR